MGRGGASLLDATSVQPTIEYNQYASPQASPPSREVKPLSDQRLVLFRAHS